MCVRACVRACVHACVLIVDVQDWCTCCQVYEKDQALSTVECTLSSSLKREQAATHAASQKEHDVDHLRSQLQKSCDKISSLTLEVHSLTVVFRLSLCCLVALRCIPLLLSLNLLFPMLCSVHCSQCLTLYLLFLTAAIGVRPPKGARPPFPDRRVPYKISIMQVV